MQQVKIISIVHEKGGTGKTTTTINLGIGLANRDKRVLLIDADASGNLTVGLGVNDRQNLPVTLATLMDDLITDREEKSIDTRSDHQASRGRGLMKYYTLIYGQGTPCFFFWVLRLEINL